MKSKFNRISMVFTVNILKSAELEVLSFVKHINICQNSSHSYEFKNICPNSGHSCEL